MREHSKNCQIHNTLLSDPPQRGPCTCGADLLNEQDDAVQKLSDALRLSREAQEKAEANKAAAEILRDCGRSAAIRIAQIITEAEADKTIPQDKNCGEAIVLRRIRDALVADGRLP